jgi:predicted enzyme related to lactoylglutathione lyase
MTAQSKFVWHDLMTTDVEKAKAFYGELFGWKFYRGEGGDPYEHIVGPGGAEIGGIMKQDPAHGAPPHWIGYVSCENVDATVKTAQANGGKTFVQPMDIPRVGRFAVVADPQGAVFSPFIYTGKEGMAAETNARPAPYTFCWDELVTTDPDAAAKFYATVFGWGVESTDMPGFGKYTLLKRTGVKDEMNADKSAGGVIKAPPMVPHPFWMTYVAVPNADDAVAKAQKLGGKVLAPAMDIPNVGRFASFMDPMNAAFAVLAPTV